MNRPLLVAETVPVRGYHDVYRRDEVNYCPACGRSHWYVGRIGGESGFCGTAVPFAADRAAA
jgi:hypothetical protein